MARQAARSRSGEVASPWSPGVLVVLVLGGLASALGVTIMMAWYAGWRAVLVVVPGSRPVTCATGLALALTGAALAGMALGSRRLPVVAAGYDIGVGAVVLAEYLAGRDLGIDRLFVNPHLPGTGGFSGRMAPSTAVCSLMIGIGVLMSAPWRRRRRASWLALPGAVVTALAVVVLFGYAAGLPGAHDWGRLSGMSPLAALGMTLVGSASMALGWVEASGEVECAQWWALPAGLLTVVLDASLWEALAKESGQTADHRAQLIRATAFIGVLLAVVAAIAVRLSQRAGTSARAARESEARYRTMLDNSPDFILRYDRDGRCLYANPALAQACGMSCESLIGRVIGAPGNDSDAFMFDSAIVTSMRDKIREVFEGCSPQEIEVTSRTDGDLRMVQFRLVPERQHGKVVDVLALGRDLTELKRLEQELAERENLFRLAFEDSLVGMSLIAVESESRFRHVRVNSAMCAFLGYSQEDLLGRRQPELLSSGDAGETETAFQDLLSGRMASYRAERRFRHADGGIVWGLLGATLIRDDASVPLLMLCQIEDITARKRAEAQLVRRALHDDLTGLPNRVLLVEHLAAALARSRRAGSHVGVLFIDLDDFKSVNDTFGHSAGDEFLSRIAARISGSVRASDVAARVGGDEFVVVCENLAEPDDATVVAEQIQQSLALQIPVGGQSVTAPASIGIALSHTESTPENLLREADAAMYVAKNHGGRRSEPARPPAPGTGR